MRKRMAIALGSALLLIVGYFAGVRNTAVVHAGPGEANAVPKSYGKLVTAFSDSIGTGLVFEDAQGVIRFVSVTGMREGELARYDQTQIHGGVPKMYGHLE